jgi:peptide/nickel transport system substrate-binding protein
MSSTRTSTVGDSGPGPRIRRGRGWSGLAALAGVLALVVAACGGNSPDAKKATATKAPKKTTAQAVQGGGPSVATNQTMYTTGTAWGPYSDLNPFKNWDYVTGTVGLVYETLFRYDPLKDQFIPWLATDGKWQGKTTYTATIRDGVTWSDGQPFTADDVKFTMDLLKFKTHPQHTLWTTGLSDVAVSGNQVTFTFGGSPNYQEFDNYLYNVPIVPQHIWKDYDEKTVVAGNVNDVSKLVGTGPYTYGGGLNSTQTFTWKRRDGWWATSALKLNAAPAKIVDIFNGSNAASLGNLLAGKIDLSNNFVPGIQKQVGAKVQTYYNSAPYMLSANTTWLFPNTTKKPLDDPAFRKALATSIDLDKIVSADYGGIVKKANPTGLLPIWDKYLDQSVVQAKGFSFDTAKAKQMLAAAGYKDANGDGYVENKDGSKIDLKLAVPNGWSDWMTAIQIIGKSAKDAGIKITTQTPDYDTLVEDRGKGNFDLVLANDRQIANTPWTYYDYIYRLPILDNQTTVNYERINDPAAWQLVQQLDQTPSSDQAGMKSVLSQLQSTFLDTLPVIPLRYNGLWAQWNTGQWKNWPSSDGHQVLPAMWRNYLQMTGIDMLTHLGAA